MTKHDKTTRLNGNVSKVNFIDKIDLRILVVSLLVLLAELAQSYLIIDIIKSILSNRLPKIDSRYLWLVCITLAIPTLNYVQAYKSQQKALKLKKISPIDLNLTKSFQNYVHNLSHYMTSAPLELHNRIGLGVISSIHFILARAFIIVALLITISIINPELLKIILITVTPLAIILFASKRVQNHYGTRMSEWIQATSFYISDLKHQIMKGKTNQYFIEESANNRIKKFAKHLSIAQATSSSLKPVVEIVSLTTLIFFAQSQELQEINDAAILAILYRLYSNGTAIVNQYSLMQSHLPALETFRINLTVQPYKLDDIDLKELLKKKQVEIRGNSGAGKSTKLEWFASQLMAEKKQYHYLSAEFLPEDAKIVEISPSYRNIFPNLKHLPADTLVKNLSLGQKKCLLIDVALNAKNGSLLIDEPFANLDAECLKIARAHLEKISVPTIISNHDAPVLGFNQIKIE